MCVCVIECIKTLIYIDAREQCKICTNGTFADEEGSSTCKACRTCSIYESLCTPLRDAKCRESACPEGWNLDADTRLCTMCARGYINVSNACVKCPENMFCDAKDNSEVCQDLRIFERGNAFVIVPSSPAGRVPPSLSFLPFFSQHYNTWDKSRVLPSLPMFMLLGWWFRRGFCYWTCRVHAMPGWFLFTGRDA